MSAVNKRVVVVGGGVIGAACAYYLNGAGCHVTIIEQGEFGRGCSHGNCGYICPSHVLPIASPGALSSTLKTLFAHNSPLKVRMRFDPALWRWFWQFAKKCNQRDMLAGGRAIQTLLASSRALYDGLLADALTDVEWEPHGLLFVFRSTHAFEHYAATDRLLREEFNLPARRLEGDALRAFEPALRDDVAGGWHYDTDGHLRPDKLMHAWRRVLEAAGVEIREHCPLLELDSNGAQARSVRTPRGDLPAEHVVIATGAWTPKLQRVIRAPIPIVPGKGYSLTMPRPALAPRVSLILEEHRVAITPLASAYRIGSTMEFAGYDTRLNPARLQLLRDGAALYLRQPHGEPVLESWYGWRPMTPDSLPLIGRAPRWDNVWLAAGHGMLGVSMSPSTGRLLAELVTGQTPHIDPAPYAVGRKL